MFKKNLLSGLIILLATSGNQAQVADLDSLYLSRPSDTDLQNIVESFNITLIDGEETYAKWDLYDPYLFRPDSTAPSIFPLVNKLRIIREQRFSKPLSFADNDLYGYMLGHFSLGGIELSLRTGNPSGGNERMYLPAVTAFWDPRRSDDPFTPIYEPFEVWPYVFGTQLFVHETRHCDADDPGHVGSKDVRLGDEGGYGRACIYSMWVYKYGLNIRIGSKMAAAIEARGLFDRFVEQPPTHPNPEIQSIVDELLQLPPLAERQARVGPDQNITLQAGEDSSAVTLDGAASYDIYSDIVEYRWNSTTPYYLISTDQPITQVKLAAGVYNFRLTCSNESGRMGLSDTLQITVTGVTGIETASNPMPTSFALQQNYPNPFNPETTIRYDLPQRAHVKLRILNILGEEIITLVEKRQEQGSQSVTWNGTDRNGHRVSSGIYPYRIQAGEFVAVKKMLFIK